MNRQEYERQVISALIMQPCLRETNGLTLRTFSNPEYKQILKALQDFPEITKTGFTDEIALWEKSGVSISELMEIQTGALIPKPEIVARWVVNLNQQGLAEQGLAIAQKEAESFVKSGDFNIDNVKEILGIWQKILDLENLTSGPTFKTLDQIEGRNVQWVWPGRIPKGMISLLVGDPDMGKSFIGIWLCSRLSKGEPLPGDSGQPLEGSTIYLSAEDSPAYALKPRAFRNGADLSKILLIQNTDFDLADDLHKIQSIVKEDSSIRLLIIDPLNSYLGSADYFKDTEVRAKLNPLIEFCEETGIACLAVMHLNKKTDLAAIYRIGGSIAFAGIARSILAVTLDPNDRDRRILRSIKMNYAKKPESLAFRIGDDLSVHFEEGPVDVGSDEYLSPRQSKEETDGSFVEEWLLEELDNGPQTAKNINRLAEEAGITKSSLYRAKKKLGVKSRPSGYGLKHGSFWELPNYTSQLECHETIGNNGKDDASNSSNSPINPINPRIPTPAHSEADYGNYKKSISQGTSIPKEEDNKR